MWEHFQAPRKPFTTIFNACKSVTVKSFIPICLSQLTLLQIIFVCHNILRLAFTSDDVRVGIESGVVSAYDPAGAGKPNNGGATSTESVSQELVGFKFLAIALKIPTLKDTSWVRGCPLEKKSYARKF